MGKSKNNFDEDQVEKLRSLIAENTDKANLDAQNEISLLHKKINEKPDILLLYEKIIEYKWSFLNSKASIYYLLDQKSCNVFYPLSINEKQHSHISKLILKFFFEFQNARTLTFESYCEKFAKDVYTHTKQKKLLSVMNQFIYTINNNDHVNFKLPTIENFEINSFKKIYEESIKDKENYNNLVKKYNTTLTELIEKNFDKNKKLTEKIYTFEDKVRSLENKLDDETFENKKLLKKIERKDFKIDLLKNEVEKKDFFTNPQFNNLYWGDNYPALKVFFDFLQVNQIYLYSWSYFASQMSIGDLTVIQLYTHNINKKELGYIFSKIKVFFSFEYKNSNSKYWSLLNRKFVIDDKIIDNTFCKNNIRRYKNTKETIKTKEEIDFLCHTIADRYH